MLESMPPALESRKKAALFAGLPVPVLVGLALSLAILLAHAAQYWFLTDDAYISFRYARNLAHGDGLVFNPGYERVEGYTNFLWVLLLAAFDFVGIAPERAANPLLLLATVALWAVVVAFVRRRLTPGLEWLVLVPAFSLALTRSIAVWSTSGLETRLFELLVVTGVLRLIDELEATERDAGPRPLAALFLALATLTRPDGLLLSASAFGAGGLYLLVRRRARFLPWALRQAHFVAIIGAHYLFRRAYYGDWLPNTYYAKVGGHSWWASGGKYLLAFAIEYGAALWLPFVGGALAWNMRRGTPLLPVVALAVIVPHTLYLAAIGGDHFEYRPLGVLLVLVFVLFADGVRALLETRLRSAGTAALVGAMAAGLVIVPWESHEQFVTSYRPGFPGLELRSSRAAQEFLSPNRNAVLRLPGLRQLAEAHRDLLRWMTERFVGVRAEEHRMFLATVLPEGLALQRLRARGVLPPDTHVAFDCVGALPYYSDLRTLDRLGLTDAHVARTAPVREVMAHSKSATMEYAKERGVHFWSIDPVHLLEPLTSMRLMTRVVGAATSGRDDYAVEVGEEGYLIGELPLGLEETRRKFPGLKITALRDGSFQSEYLTKARSALTAALAATPQDEQLARAVGNILLLARDYAAAAEHFRLMTRRYPDLLEAQEGRAVAELALGHTQEGLKASQDAFQLARRQNNAAAAERIITRAKAASAEAAP